MGEQMGAIVWQRRDNKAVHEKRMQRFWKFYVTPTALLTVVVAFVTSIGAAAGLVILFGLFGALLFVMVWLSGRNERMNPTITQDAGYLCWARRRVPIDQVKYFTTLMTSASMNVSAGAVQGGVSATASLGTARFLLLDDSKVDFAWPALEEAQLTELKSALEGVLPGRWRPVESLHDAV